MAPSTSMPTARIRPNITMLEIGMPMMPRRMKHSRNEVGIAKPTSIAERVPSAASTTIITSAMAVRTEPSSWRTMPSTCTDWSSVVSTGRCRAAPAARWRGPLDRLAHQIGGVDDVEALPLDHLQRDRGLAVEARGAGAVLEGQADIGQLAQRHDPVAIVVIGRL
jgi:hypothetical protein